MLTDKELEEIRRKMLELEEEPPVDGWEKVQAEVQPPDTNWRPIGWFGVILLLLLATLGGYFFMNRTPAPDTLNAPATRVQQEQAAATAPTDGNPTKRQQAQEAKSPALTAPVETPPLGQPRQNTDTPAETELQEQQPAGRAPQEQARSVENIPAYTAPQPDGAAPLPATLAAQDTVRRHPAERSTSAPASIAAAEVTAVKTPVASGAAAEEKETTPVQAAASSDGKLSSIITELSSEKGFALPDSVSPIKIAAQEKKAAPKADKREEKADKDKASMERKEWYLGLTVAPRYAFRSFTPTTADEVFITDLTNRKALDPERLGYEVGVTMGRKLKEQLYLETSLSLMQLRENVAYTYSSGEIDSLVRELQSDGSLKIIPVLKEVERQLKSSYAYGGLRVGMTYFFLERAQSRFNVTAAAGMNLLVKGRTKEYIDGEWNETIIFPSKDNILEQSNYNLMFGAGYNLTLHNKYELMLMPTVNYFLGSTFQEREPFGLRPYTLGLSLQIRRSFGRP